MKKDLALVLLAAVTAGRAVFVCVQGGCEWEANRTPLDPLNRLLALRSGLDFQSVQSSIPRIRIKDGIVYPVLIPCSQAAVKDTG